MSAQEEVESEEEGGVFMDLSNLREARELEVYMYTHLCVYYTQCHTCIYIYIKCFSYYSLYILV